MTIAPVIKSWNAWQTCHGCPLFSSECFIEARFFYFPIPISHNISLTKSKGLILELNFFKSVAALS